MFVCVRGVRFANVVHIHARNVCATRCACVCVLCTGLNTTMQTDRRRAGEEEKQGYRVHDGYIYQIYVF